MHKTLGIVLALLVAGGVTLFMVQRAGRPGAASAFRTFDALVSADRVTVTARQPGVLKEVVVRTGDVLVRGQVVALVAGESADADAARARQDLAALDARLRAEQAALALQQTRVPAAIKAAQAAADLARAELQRFEALEEQLWQAVERLRAIEDPDEQEQEQLAAAELALERAQQDVLVAQAAVTRAESDLELVELGREEIIAHITEIDALLADRQRAALAVAAAEIGTKDLEVTAPLGGTVLSVMASAGEAVVPGTPIAELVNLESLHVLVELDDASRASWRPGLEVRVIVEGGEVPGTVTAVLPEGAKIECRETRSLAWGRRVGVVPVDR